MDFLRMSVEQAQQVTLTPFRKEIKSWQFSYKYAIWLQPCPSGVMKLDRLGAQLIIFEHTC